MGIATAVCLAMAALAAGASPAQDDFPFLKSGPQGLPKFGAPAKPGTPPSGFFAEPIVRNMEILRDFLVPRTPEEEALPSPPTVSDLPALQVCYGDAEVGGVALPAVSLHPEGLTAASLAFAAVVIRPHTGTWTKDFLLVKVGLADPLMAPPQAAGSAADVAHPTPASPVPVPPLAAPGLPRLTVAVAGKSVLAVDVPARRWDYYAIDMTDYAGQTVPVAFQASGAGPTDRATVISLGEPVLIEETGPFYVPPTGGRGMTFGFNAPAVTGKRTGLLLADIRCTVPSAVSLSFGDASHEFVIEPGERWLPLPFASSGKFLFKPLKGDAKLQRVDIVPVPSTKPVVPGAVRPGAPRPPLTSLDQP